VITAALEISLTQVSRQAQKQSAAACEAGAASWKRWNVIVTHSRILFFPTLGAIELPEERQESVGPRRSSEIREAGLTSALAKGHVDGTAT